MTVHHLPRGRIHVARAEDWRAVPGWDGYEVSDLGNVRSWKRCRRSPLEVLPRALATHAGRNGYPAVALKDRGRRWSACVHWLVAEAFIGPRPDGAHIAHFDGDKTNNAPNNLRYATPAENAADRVRLGEQPHGERCHTTNMTDETARAIRDFVGTHREAADAFGVRYHLAYCIRTGRTWRRL